MSTVARLPHVEPGPLASTAPKCSSKCRPNKSVIHSFRSISFQTKGTFVVFINSWGCSFISFLSSIPHRIPTIYANKMHHIPTQTINNISRSFRKSISFFLILCRLQVRVKNVMLFFYCFCFFFKLVVETTDSQPKQRGVLAESSMMVHSSHVF